MALCLAESLVECQKFNPVDQAKRYWRWYQVKQLDNINSIIDGNVTKGLLFLAGRSPLQ